MDLPDFLSRDRYGFIHLTSHRVGLLHIVDGYRGGESVELLHEHFPSVPMALLQKVLAFYLENQAEVDAYVAGCHAAIARQAAAPRSGPAAAELRRWMDALHSTCTS